MLSESTKKCGIKIEREAVMEYRMIDMSTYPRQAHFAYFNAMPDPYVGVTVDVEIGPVPERELALLPELPVLHRTSGKCRARTLTENPGGQQHRVRRLRHLPHCATG